MAYSEEYVVLRGMEIKPVVVLDKGCVIFSEHMPY
jgi:hypothetical protein